MTGQILAALGAVLLTVIGVCGIIVPVLPGSLAVLSGLLVWALWGGSGSGWIVFAIGGLFVAAGISAQYLITGRQLKRDAIPNRSLVWGLVCGVVGLFVIPFLGLPLGFAAGLFGSEYARLRDAAAAGSASVAALKSVGVGMLVELGCALAAASVLLVGILADGPFWS